MSTYEELRLKELENNPEKLKKLLQDNEKMRYQAHSLEQENMLLRARINNKIGIHWTCSFCADVVCAFGKKSELSIDDDTIEATCEDENYDWSSDLDTLIYLDQDELVKGLRTGKYYFYIEVQTEWTESGWETIEYDCNPNITYKSVKKIENTDLS